MLVTSPNGGEIWRVQGKTAVSWQLPGYSVKKKLNISLSLDGGNTWKVLKRHVKNTGAVRVLVKKSYRSRQALVRICLPKGKGVSVPVCDYSDAPFSIIKSR